MLIYQNAVASTVAATKTNPSDANVAIGSQTGAQFTVASTMNTNGAANAPVTITYTVKSGWIQNNFILMTIPKANLLYSAGASNTPTSLITSSNFGSAGISIAGTTYQIDST